MGGRRPTSNNAMGGQIKHVIGYPGSPGDCSRSGCEHDDGVSCKIKTIRSPKATMSRRTQSRRQADIESHKRNGSKYDNATTTTGKQTHPASGLQPNYFCVSFFFFCFLFSGSWSSLMLACCKAMPDWWNYFRHSKIRSGLRSVRRHNRTALSLSILIQSSPVGGSIPSPGIPDKRTSLKRTITGDVESFRASDHGPRTRDQGVARTFNRGMARFEVLLEWE